MKHDKRNSKRLFQLLGLPLFTTKTTYGFEVHIAYKIFTTAETYDEGSEASLEMKVHDSSKIVEIWLTSAEKENSVIQDKLKGLYSEFKAKRYTVAVFQSGASDLLQNTRALLMYNKRKFAEMMVQNAKTSHNLTAVNSR